MSLISYNPGRMDRRVSLQSKATTRDAAGGPVVAWSTLASEVPAEKNPPRVGRLYAAEAKLSEANTIFRIRYRTDVMAFMRLVHGSATYEITGDPIEVGRAQFMDLACRALNQPTANAA
jgi:SPP1 family predicted phage head-tail adaptor